MIIGIAIGGCLILVFGIIGVIMLIKYFQEKEKSERSQKWSSAMGKVIKSYMRHETNYESGNTIYYPEVSYEYEFLGTIYTGYRISFGGSSGNSNHKKSQEILRQYPINRNVTVYHDPHNPENAVLERRIGSGSKVLLIIGILFSSISLCALCVSMVMGIASLAGY